MKKTIRKETEMKTVKQLVDFIGTKPDKVDSVLIESDSFRLDIPIVDKDVMCMKVINLIRKEYRGHTIDESNSMLQDTIWWLTMMAIAFADGTTDATVTHHSEVE